MVSSAPKQAGFTLVEIMIAVVIIGLVLAITLPNIARARTTAQKNACIMNLKQISGAKDMWALEKKKSAGSPVDTNANFLSNFKNSTMPLCPLGGVYNINAIARPPDCSLGPTFGHTF